MTEAISTNVSVNVTSPAPASGQQHRFTEDGQGLWVACQAVTVLCSLFDVYFILCLSLHWWRESRPATGQSYFSKSARAKNDSQWGSTASRIATVNSSRRSTAVDALNPPARRPNSRERAYRRWMLIFGLGASSSALLKCLVDQVKFFHAWDSRSDDACEVINDVTEVGLYGSTMVCVYAFLWVRQWMFYHNPAVKNLIYRKHLIRFSRFLPVVILTLLLVLSVFHLIPIKYRADASLGVRYLGCVAVYDIANTHEALPIFFYIALTSTFQLSLLGLFLYPLVRRKIDAYRMGQVACPSPSPSHRSRMASGGLKSSQPDVTRASYDSFLAPPGPAEQRHASLVNAVNGGLNNPSASSSGCLDTKQLCAPYRWLKSRLSGAEASGKNQSTTRESAPGGRRNDLRVNTRAYTLSKGMQRSVVRAVMWTTMCIISDVTMVTVTLLFGPGTPLVFIGTMNNFNIVVNQLCLIATYSKWKAILLPMCAAERNKAPHSSVTQPTSDASPGARRAEPRFEYGSRLIPSPSKFTFDEISTLSVADSNAPSVQAPSSEPGSPAFAQRDSFHQKRSSL